MQDFRDRFVDPRTVIILMLMAICGVANAADKKKPVETPSQPVSAPVPVMKPLKDIKVEASGLTTHISLGEMSAEFPVGKSTITWTVTGPDGTVSSATQTVIVTDTVAPVVTVPADITLEATAPQTPVKLGSATAIDVVDGKLTPAPDQTGPFGVGVHQQQRLLVIFQQAGDKFFAVRLQLCGDQGLIFFK